MVPGLQMRAVETLNEQDGGYETISVPFMSESILRVSSSCSLQLVCPEFVAGSDRAFQIPVEMRTIEQLRGWASMLIEMQMQRVNACEGGEGHACRWPTVRFGGSPGKAWKAVGWLLDWGLPVRTLVTWSFERIALSLPRGPEWYVEFWEKLTV